MKNAHLRFGWLTCVKCTEKTTTFIKLRLVNHVGSVNVTPNIADNAANSN
jgi:hypothetical protein